MVGNRCFLHKLGGFKVFGIESGLVLSVVLFGWSFALEPEGSRFAALLAVSQEVFKAVFSPKNGTTAKKPLKGRRYFRKRIIGNSYSPPVYGPFLELKKPAHNGQVWGSYVTFSYEKRATSLSQKNERTSTLGCSTEVSVSDLLVYFSTSDTVVSGADGAT